MLKRWIFEYLKPWTAQRLEWLLLWYYARSAKRRRCRHETGCILIARTDGLGDYLLWLDAQKRLRSLFPDKKLVILLDAEKPTMLLAEQNLDIDEVITVHVHRFVRFFEIFRMRKLAFDLILQPIYGRTAFTDLLLFACRSDLRITLDGNRRFLTRWEKQIADAAYDRVIPAQKGVKHELLRCGEMLRGLGALDYQAGLARIPVQTEGEPLFCPPYIVVYPGGSWREKCWAPERFAEVCDWMFERTGKTVLLCGGKNDKELAEEIWHRMTHRRNAAIFAGKHSICQSLELIRHADFVFGNDTGAIHMAAVCRVPAVAIVVGREIGRFFPYESERPEDKSAFPAPVFAQMPCLGCMLEEDRPCKVPGCGTGRLPCIDEISVGQVQAVVEGFL